MLGRRILLPFTGILAAIGGIAAAPHQAQVRPTITPYKSSGIYAQDEKAGWTIRAAAGSATKYHYTLKENNAVDISSGDIDISNGPAAVEVKTTKPMMVFMQLKAEGQRPMDFGAAIEPTKLKPVQPKPRDFDAFWKRKIDELHKIPENAVLTPSPSGKPGVDYATIRMDHVNGTHVYGQIARPATPGKHPAMLILQWASPPYRLWSPWVVDRAAEGWLALNIEPHDVLPTEPQSYYDALPQALKNYNSIGQEDKETSYFVEMYLRDYRAVDYLTHCPDWDGKTLLVMGTSMGGQQSFAVAGLHPKVTHLIVNVPAGCDLVPPRFGRQEGYPFFPTDNAKVMEAARYVDCVNFASHIRATSLVAMGFVDTISPPAGVWTVLNQIRGKKEAAPMIDSPHNNLATAEQQRPYTERSAAWLNALVKGDPAPIRSLEVKGPSGK